MSIWGKIIGGFGGFAIGGPLGALMGAVAGHAYDKSKDNGDAHYSDDSVAQQVAFTTAIIALAAKMAKSDGRVTRDEVDAFKSLFNIPQEELKNVGRLFNEAKKDAGGFERYAEQVSMMFASEPVVLEELLGGLFYIARADGVLHPEEIDFLHKTAMILGFSEIQFERLKAIHMGDLSQRRETLNPYQVLGIKRDVSDSIVKNTYRRLIRENHPDTLIAKGMPQEFIDVANEKMAAINAAYDLVEKERGLK
ncbi:MAG: co-chaperone DjlA [Pseudomonadota bacterium]|nr:co-chaperone DjlA [Pseudomonadota bacterium]